MLATIRPSARLKRNLSTDDGTLGTLTATNSKGDFLTLVSLELPWRDNRRSLSCIPEGTYDCVWHQSPRFGWCYMVTSVEGRSEILIHAGNWAGDVQKGRHSDVRGCILLGLTSTAGVPIGKREKQLMVSKSRVAITEFHKHMGEKPFELKVTSSD